MLFRLSAATAAAIVIALSLAIAGPGVIASSAQSIAPDGLPPPSVINQQKPHALAYTCTVSPSTVYPGDPIKVIGSASGEDARKQSSYTWEVSSGKFTGKDAAITISTAGLAPGNYLISGRVSQGKRTSENASCAETFAVIAPPPPTLTCAANPASVKPDGWSMITANISGTPRTHLRYSYTSSAGEITGSNSIATLNTLNAPPGPITVECTVRDDLGLNATSTAVVYVHSTLAPVAQRRKLCGLNFATDIKRPVHVDSEATVCLDDVAWILKHQAPARLAITGERSPDESMGQAWARAANARDYLTKEKGIDPARIDIEAGSLKTRTVEMELIPDGAAINPPAANHSSADRPKILFIPDTGDVTGTRPVPIIETAPATSPIAHPTYLGPGIAGPRRTTNSLILPPLPGDTKTPAKPRDKSRSAKDDSTTKPIQHPAPAIPPAAPGTSTTTAPNP